jgi:hypothetical protein
MRSEIKNPAEAGFFVNPAFESGSNDTDVMSVLASLPIKSDGSISYCKQCVVATNVYIVAGMELGPALADQDVTGDNCFTAVTFYAEVLWV